MLLPGEYNAVKPIYAGAFGLAAERIVTAGLHPDMDHRWNYEQDPPAGLGPFDCIVSQAMIEHLVDPYRHLRDCAGLLAPGGHLVVHTVLPGFTYHRHPVDCLRFFPDWFEEVGRRLGLAVADRVIHDGHIVYKYRRP
jgi:SAM-dependent methyltransferase